jgi:IclR family transcriptional regulator, acetate operon repressor
MAWTVPQGPSHYEAVRPTERDNAADSVLGKAFALLGSFRAGDGAVSFAEMARRSGVARPTAHRLLHQLATHGAIELSEEGVRLGMRLFEIGQLAARPRGLREAATPFLSDLFRATGETVHLAVADGDDVIYVHKLDGRLGPALGSRVGGRMPAYCTGVGKVLLAYAEPERLRTLLEAGLTRRTPRTIIAPGMLMAELERVRERGFAEEHEESTVGIACVAAPVFDAAGAAVAAVSVAGRTHKIDTSRLAPAVRTAALGIGRSLCRGSD